MLIFGHIRSNLSLTAAFLLLIQFWLKKDVLQNLTRKFETETAIGKIIRRSEETKYGNGWVVKVKWLLCNNKIKVRNKVGDL